MRSHLESYRSRSIAAVLELFTVDKAADVMCGNQVSLLNNVALSFLSNCPFVVVSINVFWSIKPFYISNNYVEDEWCAYEPQLFFIL